MKKTNLKLLAAMAIPVLVLPQQSFAGFWPPFGFPKGKFPTIPMQN